MFLSLNQFLPKIFVTNDFVCFVCVAKCESGFAVGFPALNKVIFDFLINGQFKYTVCDYLLNCLFRYIVFDYLISSQIRTHYF